VSGRVEGLPAPMIGSWGLASFTLFGWRRVVRIQSAFSTRAVSEVGRRRADHPRSVTEAPHQRPVTGVLIRGQHLIRPNWGALPLCAVAATPFIGSAVVDPPRKVRLAV